MQLQDILFSQGFGTRRACAGLVQQGRVEVGARTVRDPAAEFEAEGLRFCVEGQPWLYQRQAYLMLHKPAGTECSHRPSAHPSVYSLLPGPLRQRPARGAVPGVQAVGRLDQDTTGLLLLTDDGQFLHRMASPRHHVPKLYYAHLAHADGPALCERLLAGVQLHDEPRPVAAAACTLAEPTLLHLVLTEGKYHQVKRMVAAAGNRVVALHRARIGGLELPADLAPGRWRWLTAQELALAQQAAPASGSLQG